MHLLGLLRVALHGLHVLGAGHALPVDALQGRVLRLLVLLVPAQQLPLLPVDVRVVEGWRQAGLPHVLHLRRWPDGPPKMSSACRQGRKVAPAASWNHVIQETCAG
jgi:hypothetical protein